MKSFGFAIGSLVLGYFPCLAQTPPPPKTQTTATFPTVANRVQTTTSEANPDEEQPTVWKSTPAFVEPDQTDMERIVFIRREKLPDSPKPNKLLSKEGGGCPGGVGSPCALLGGFHYYRDLAKTDQHERTWWDAFKTPGMLFAVSSLAGTTVLDIQGTEACIHAHTCRELNPLMGQRSIARKYAIGVPLAAFVIWGSVREKQHGHGTTAMLLLWGASCVHFYFGAGGFNAAKTH